MDPTKEYEKEWSKKVEKDSVNVFNLAFEDTKENPNMKVIILQRLPRFDPKAVDTLSIKSKLSEFTNKVYDQIWF